jgi:hypothetical protein
LQDSEKEKFFTVSQIIFRKGGKNNLRFLGAGWNALLLLSTLFSVFYHHVAITWILAMRVYQRLMTFSGRSVRALRPPLVTLLCHSLRSNLLF